MFHAPSAVSAFSLSYKGTQNVQNTVRRSSCLPTEASCRDDEDNHVKLVGNPIVFALGQVVPPSSPTVGYQEHPRRQATAADTAGPVKPEMTERRTSSGD